MPWCSPSGGWAGTSGLAQALWVLLEEQPGKDREIKSSCLHLLTLPLPSKHAGDGTAELGFARLAAGNESWACSRLGQGEPGSSTEGAV